MASSSLTDHFTTALQDVSRKLSEENIRDLVNSIGSVTDSNRENISGGMELFTQLQELDILHENNVNTLIHWLEELKLHEACKPLISYKDKYLQQTNESEEHCKDHINKTLIFFCITCDVKICRECYTCSHKKVFGCDVIGVASIAQKIQSRRKAFRDKLTALRENTAQAKMLFSEKEKSILQKYEKMLNRIRADEVAMQKEIQKNEEKFLKAINEKEKHDLEEIASEQRNIEDIVTTIESMEDVTLSFKGEAVTALRRVRLARKKVGNFQRALEQLQEDLKDKFPGVSYKEPHGNFTFGELRLYPLVGGVTVNKAQIVHLFDYRQINGCIRLVCIDNTDPKKEHWKYEISTDAENNEFPVVMSYLSLVCRYENYDRATSDFMSLLSHLKNEADHVLFAVGKRVSLVRSEWDSGELYKTLDLHDIEDTSWITSICGHYGLKARFIISVSNNSFLREYDVSGDPLRIIDLKDWMPAVTGVAYIENSIAVIGRGHSDAILVKTADIPEQSGSLILPTSPQSFLPVCLIWTGATWVVLYVSGDSGKDWKVVQYDKEGAFMTVCSIGTSNDESNTPVSITRWQNTGYTSFSNSTIGVFSH